MNSIVLNGSSEEVLKQFPDNHFDSIVTDPPYLIDFLGKAWDNKNNDLTPVFNECFRVLKPGGHMLAFSAARSYHWIAVMIENAGFEIRDQIMWIYSSGFPKSQDVGKSIDRSAGKKNKLKDRGTKGTKGDKIVKNSPGSGTLCPGCGRDSNARYSCDKGIDCGMVYKPETEKAKQWAGWGTQLKPAHEPICLARKPIKLSIARNCQRWGVGALNIDATRVPWGEDDDLKEWYAKYPEQKSKDGVYTNYNPELQDKVKVDNKQPIDTTEVQGRFPSNVIGEIPDYQKYFYCPKVGRRERHIGLDDPGTMNHSVVDHLDKQSTEKGNNHPTVKPIELMKYLIKLVTPKGGRVLDPFNGSGSTGCAAVELDYQYTGIELDAKYVEIATKRIQAWYEATHLPGVFEYE